MTSVRIYLVEYETDNGLAGQGVIGATTVEEAIKSVKEKHKHLTITGVRETRIKIL